MYKQTTICIYNNVVFSLIFNFIFLGTFCSKSLYKHYKNVYTYTYLYSKENIMFNTKKRKVGTWCMMGEKTVHDDYSTV